MSRQQFTSRNNIGQVLTFQKSGATPSFNPYVLFDTGSKRVSWRLDNGSGITQTAGNSLTYTGFTSDTEIRTIQIRGNNFENISYLYFSNCNLYGELNLSKFKELKPYFVVGGTVLNLNNNLNLTGITNPISTSNIWLYDASATGLYNLDLTPFSGGSILNLNSFNCPNLSGITLGQNLSISDSFNAFNSNLTGNLDLTPLSNLSGSINVELNPLLTDIILPVSSGDFSNGGLSFQGCDLNYVDMKPLSGASVYNSVILFNNNNMITTDVNHILVDFSGNATYNSVGWSNIILDISGTNAAPDAVSGGYDGLAAITFLTGSPYNWTIIY